MINATTGALTAVKGSPFATGEGLVGVVVDPTGQFVYVANVTTTTFPPIKSTRTAAL